MKWPKRNETDKAHGEHDTHVVDYGKEGRTSFDTDTDEEGMHCGRHNMHTTRNSDGYTYYHQDTEDGRHSAGDVTDSKGNRVPPPSYGDWIREQE